MKSTVIAVSTAATTTSVSSAKPKTRHRGTYSYQISASGEIDAGRFHVNSREHSIAFVCNRFHRALNRHRESIRPHCGQIVSHEIVSPRGLTLTELTRELGHEYSLVSSLVHLDHSLLLQALKEVEALKEAEALKKAGALKRAEAVVCDGPLNIGAGMKTHFFLAIDRITHVIVLERQPRGKNWRLELHEAQSHLCPVGSWVAMLPKRK